MSKLDQLREYSAKCKQIKRDEGLVILERFKTLLPEELRKVFTYSNPHTFYDGETFFNITVDDFSLEVKYNSKTKVYRIDKKTGMLWNSNYTDFHELTDYIIDKMEKQLEERRKRAVQQARELTAKL